MASELESLPRPARRAGAGLVRATERDLRLLRWAAEQYAVSIPQLARLMGRSEHAARWLRGRWQRAGWAQGRTLVVGRPVFVWLTRDGSRVAGAGFKVWRRGAGAHRGGQRRAAARGATAAGGGVGVRGRADGAAVGGRAERAGSPSGRGGAGGRRAARGGGGGADAEVAGAAGADRR